MFYGGKIHRLNALGVYDYKIRDLWRVPFGRLRDRCLVHLGKLGNRLSN